MDRLLSDRKYDKEMPGGCLAQDMAVSPDQAVLVEETTRGQSGNPLWAAYPRGRITAFNFGPV